MALSAVQRASEGARYKSYGLMLEVINKIQQETKAITTLNFNSKKQTIIAEIDIYLKELKKYSNDPFCVAEIDRWEELKGRIFTFTQTQQALTLKTYLTQTLTGRTEPVKTKRVEIGKLLK